MKLPDMLLQAELIGRWFKDEKVIFIGDGDAIALSLVHLGIKKLLPSVPKHVTVLDFDERVVNSVNHFASQYELSSLIHAELYNVADALPAKHWQQHSAFYCNPPWEASNGGSSVCAFIERGIEAMNGDALGCIVIGDHPHYRWTHEVQMVAQSLLLKKGFRIAEMLPQFHKYHLDDNPELTSCSLIAQRETLVTADYDSKPLSDKMLQNFYGADSPLKIHYVMDLRNGGKFESHDIKPVPFHGEANDATKAAE